MRTKTIKFNLTERGINKAIKELQEYKKRINQRLIWLLETMRLDGETYAASYMTHYGTGITSGSIVGYREGNRAVIEAGGAAIWIEFGTGVLANAGNAPHPKKDEVGAVGWGEYGLGLGKDTWWFTNKYGKQVWTAGIHMNPFMYETSQELQANLTEIARRAWNND